MRSPSILSEASVKPSFFLTTPAKKPRTECCCQSVAFMMAAMVVPFCRRSSARTACCFEGEGKGDVADADFIAATPDAASDFDRLGPLALALQLPFMQVSESMGNHDSKIVDAASVD